MAGKILLALGLLGFVLNAEAATNELTTQLRTPKRLQITLLAQAASNLYETHSRDNESEGRLTIAPSYKLGADYRASLSASLLQQFQGAQESQLSNAKLALTRIPLSLTQDSLLIPLVGLRLPTNMDDRKKNSYNGSVVIENTLLTNWTAFGSPFATLFGLYLTKNVHTYDRNAAGGANLDYSANGYFGIEKEFLPKFSILLDADYTYATTYQNSMRTLFSMGQSLTYQHNKDLSVTVGHTNAGDALKANGTDYNISVFDGNTSVVYANVRAVF